MSNHTLRAAVQYTLEVKKSRFLAYVYPVENRAQAMQKVAKLRIQHPEARHVCWAFTCSTESGMNDDKEPHGTAGKPMFSVLRHNDVTNVLAVVVRYFGGIKLGASGLVRAYSQATSLALQLASLVEVIPLGYLECTLAFAQENKLRHWCEISNVEIASLMYEAKLIAVLQLPLAQQEQAKQALTDLLLGQVQFANKNESGIFRS
jgi:uncharacterized YigZ family protein